MRMAMNNIFDRINSKPAAQSLREEIVNSIIHGIGFALSIGGFCVLIVSAVSRGTVWHVVSCAIFGSSLVSLYMISTLYHGLQGARTKQIFRRLDHICIYLLIAGSYTPFTLTFLRGGYGWAMFGFIWTLAGAGILVKGVFGPRFNVLSTGAYLVMGWLIVVAAKPMIEGFPLGGLILLATGGLCYTIGVPFYLLDHKVRYFHAVWHIFVLAGSISHFFTVLLFIVPAAA
jgi:hemolysin III